jgi:hypothetical protein
MTMSVKYQPTPNPNAGKFTVGRRVVDDNRSRSFYDVAQAQAEPIAAALFELDGVASIFMVEDFVTVTKQPDAEWSDLIPRVTSTLERVLS